MAQSFADVLSWVPKSRQLAMTLTRAHDFARAQAHGRVTLEHLLLSLIEDPDGSLVLQACQVDLQRLTADVNGYLDQLPAVQHPTPEADPDLVRILDYAVAAAQQSRRREVNGAIVLAAIVGEGKSEAARILQSHGLTFAEAIRALQTTNVSQRPKTAATTGPSVSAAASLATEAVLAKTRQRIEEASRGSASAAAPTETADGPPTQPPPIPAPAAASWTPPPETSQEPAGARPQRRPPPIPPAPGAPVAPHAGNGEWPPEPLSAADRLGEALRPAGAPWPEATAPSSPHRDAPADARYRTNAAGPPYPDSDQLTAPRAPTGSLRAAIRGSRAPASASFDPGALVENIPRSMRVGVPETIEVRIARAQVAALADGLSGRGAAYQHSIIVTKAMAVRLRAPAGGFWIETTSPETQWIENTLGLLNDDYASWRWTVTPQRRGRGTLQLIISARTVGVDGLAAETALPDQTVDVRVRTNYQRSLRRWSVWIIAAVIGGALAKFGDQGLELGLAALRKFMGGG